jgi:hypothetical protein
MGTAYFDGGRRDAATSCAEPSDLRSQSSYQINEMASGRGQSAVDGRSETTRECKTVTLPDFCYLHCDRL